MNYIIYDENRNTIHSMRKYLEYCLFVDEEVNKYLLERKNYISIRSFNKWFLKKYKCTLYILKNAFVRNLPTFTFETHPNIIHNTMQFLFYKYDKYLTEYFKTEMTNVEIYNKLIQIDPLLIGLNKITVMKNIRKMRNFYKYKM